MTKEVVEYARSLASGALGIPQPRRAFELLEQAAVNDPSNRSLARELSLYYRDGIGVAQNSEKAFEWLLRAARAGSIGAQLRIADSYINGVGVEADPNEAMVWLERPASAGAVSALIRLGRAYAAGFGVPLDHQKPSVISNKRRIEVQSPVFAKWDAPISWVWAFRVISPRQLPPREGG
ncbi:MAG: tetratricopeptide repeat protein [Candidatus Competibacteraceae bacterium]